MKNSINSLRRLVNDLATVNDYSNYYRHHSEADTFERIKKDLKESIVGNLKDALSDNEFIKEALDEIYQDRLNKRAFKFGELKNLLHTYKENGTDVEELLSLVREIESEILGEF